MRIKMNVDWRWAFVREKKRFCYYIYNETKSPLRLISPYPKSRTSLYK